MSTGLSAKVDDAFRFFYPPPSTLVPSSERPSLNPPPVLFSPAQRFAVGGELNYFLQRIGGEACSPLQVGSPFDYSRQMHLQLPTEFPPPNQTAYESRATKAIAQLVHQSQARAFVLFTNTRFMRHVADELRHEFETEGYLFLVQGSDLAPAKCLNHSANTPQAFSLDSIVSGWVSMFKAMPSAT